MTELDAVRAYRDAWLRSQSLHGYAVVAAADAAIAEALAVIERQGKAIQACGLCRRYVARDGTCEHQELHGGGNPQRNPYDHCYWEPECWEPHQNTAYWLAQRPAEGGDQ